MKAIIATFEEPESSHSFEIAVFDESHYSQMEQFFAEIKPYGREYPGPYFSIADYTPPVLNPQKLSDFFSPPKDVTPKQLMNEIMYDFWSDDKPPGTKLTVIVAETEQTRKAQSKLPPDFGTDSTLEPPDHPVEHAPKGRTVWDEIRDYRQPYSEWREAVSEIATEQYNDPYGQDPTSKLLDEHWEQLYEEGWTPLEALSHRPEETHD